MLDEKSGNKWFFVGLGLSAIVFLVVLFSFPQVSATAVSLITPASEYESMGLSGSTIAINPTEMSEISENTTHQSRLYIKDENTTTQTIIRSTTKQSGSLQKTTVKRYSDEELVYTSYWTTDLTHTEISNIDSEGTSRFVKEGNEFSTDQPPSNFDIDINRLYSVIYMDLFEWRPIRYTSRYGNEVVVYGVMKMPYESRAIPFTKYRHGRVYVERDSGRIIEAHVGHNYGQDPVQIDYYINAVPRESQPPEWIKSTNFN